MALLAITKAIHTLIAAETSVTNTIEAAKIFDSKSSIPQGTQVPYIVISKINTESIRHLGGRNTLTRARIEIDIYGSPAAPGTTQTVADAIDAILDEYSDTVALSSDSVVIEYIHAQDESDSQIPIQNGRDTHVPRIRQEYEVGYRRS